MDTMFTETLMSVRLVQLKNKGRKISTKNGKEKVQSMENVSM
jgi:hypothetical protein